MLYHVHHILNDQDKARESFTQFETARRLALDLIKTYGGETYITGSGVIQWDSRELKITKEGRVIE